MDVRQAAEAWIGTDPDEATRQELRALIEHADWAELRERMVPLEFGTAGLRALVGAGPGRMNRAVVRRASLALAAHLRAKHERGESVPPGPIVVGADNRLSSRSFLEEAVSVLVANGLRVRYFDEPVPTPLLAYAARELAAPLGMAITASHNPAEYNGLKVYAANGAQLIPPEDQQIACWMADPVLAAAATASYGVLDRDEPLARSVESTVIDGYFAALHGLHSRDAAAHQLAIVYTPLHGLGASPVRRALAEAGFTRLYVVPEQAEPDGRFPTVSFPNPEEPRALERALAFAQQSDARLLLANDPDVDRLAVCVKSEQGWWKTLTGNQLGLLLGDYALSRAPREPRPLVLSSIVSSPMLDSLAAEHGARVEHTLTGFKWIWNAALGLEQSEHVRFVFGYEEALGYSLTPLVHDKDGISAAVATAEMALEQERRGSSLLLRLEALYRRHGLWVSAQHSVVLPGQSGVATIAAALERLTSSPPKAIGGRRVVELLDYRRDAEQRPPWLGKAPLCELRLAGGRVLLRPSGTEPKLKIYVDQSLALGAAADVWQSEAKLAAEAGALARELVDWLGLGGHSA